MKVFYSPRYEVSLPGHIWPTSQVPADRRAPGPIRSRSVEPAPASWDDLALVHTGEYLDKLRDEHADAGRHRDARAAVAAGARRRVSPDGRRHLSRRRAAALDDGRAAHLGGGLHHAFANHGEGFCPLNDVAVADPRRCSATGGMRRAAIVDLDVHHGNGTSMIFERDPDVFTFSIHQQLNYPFFKPRSDLDIGLEDGAGDERYLDALAAALPRVLGSRPELVVYLAGADPFEDDRLGGLAADQGRPGGARPPRVRRRAPRRRAGRRPSWPAATPLTSRHRGIHAATIRALLSAGTRPA